MLIGLNLISSLTVSPSYNERLLEWPNCKGWSNAGRKRKAIKYVANFCPNDCSDSGLHNETDSPAPLTFEVAQAGVYKLQMSARWKGMIIDELLLTTASPDQCPDSLRKVAQIQNRGCSDCPGPGSFCDLSGTCSCGTDNDLNCHSRAFLCVQLSLLSFYCRTNSSANR